MEISECKVFYAKNLQELFSNLKNIQNLKITGATTQLKKLPEKFISTRNIPELKKISKHERFIDFGPATTLSEIEALGARHLPKILYNAITTVANPFVRNIATIGGNLCSRDFRHTLYAPLLALDTKLELKTETETNYVSLLNFEKFKPGQILTNIRVPLSDWDVELFYRTGPQNKITEDSASFAFVALSEKNIITTLKIAFAGKIVFRNLEFESKFLGLRLPISEKQISSILEEAEFYFDKSIQETEFRPILKYQFLNLLKFALNHLT